MVFVSEAKNALASWYCLHDVGVIEKIDFSIGDMNEPMNVVDNACKTLIF